MSKISIVGVEGSGKTTLMAAFGEKYERPDRYGYGLKAANARTFDVVKLLTARMRKGQWPSATEAGTVTNLDWTLYRREGASRKDICSVSFLDFAGEVYRKAFGEREAGVNQKQVEALRNHIKESDALVVLINLKDIINGDLTDARTREMLWISQGIIEHAVDTCKIKRVALAFSQFGVYREAVEAAGGLKGAYAKYLPNVEAIYPDLQLLAISAVDKTVVDADGREIPASDFTSTGLERLMEWVLCCTHKDAVADHEQECRGWVGVRQKSYNDALNPVPEGKKKRRRHRTHRKHQNVQQNDSTENDRTSSSHLSEFHRTLLDLTLLDLKNDWRYLKSEGVWKALLGCVFFMGPTLGFWGVYGVAVVLLSATRGMHKLDLWFVWPSFLLAISDCFSGRIICTIIFLIVTIGLGRSFNLYV